MFDIAVPASATADILRQLPEQSGVLMQKPMGESIEEVSGNFDDLSKRILWQGVNFQLRQAPYMIAAEI